MSTYYLELGFDWDTATIGTAVANRDADKEASIYRPLQLGFVNRSSLYMANFVFSSDDAWTLYLVNLSDNQNLSLSYLALTLTVPETATRFDGQLFEPSLPSLCSPMTSFGSSDFIRCRAFGFPDVDYQTWDLSSTAYQIQDQGADTTVEVSAFLSVSDPDSGTTRDFLVDPEMWIQGGG